MVALKNLYKSIVMENFNLFRQMSKTLIFTALAASLLISCNTGELQDEVSVLLAKQSQIIAQRDSLQQLLNISRTKFDTVLTNLNSMTEDFHALEDKNKSLQSQYYRRGEEIKKLVAENQYINQNLDTRRAENDSLKNIIVSLQQKVETVETEKTETEKHNEVLAQTLKVKEEKIIADSIAIVNKPKPVKETGFISINEIGGGFGLGVVTEDYGRSIVSLNTIAGYRVNRHFTAGLGTGVNFYNGGYLIPVYMDFRYRITDRKVTPFFVADGGVVFSTNGLSSSGLFINPGFGFEKKLTSKVSFHLTGGIMVQQAPDAVRNSYFNFKGGISIWGK
jgi:hypothetical protein